MSHDETNDKAKDVLSSELDKKITSSEQSKILFRIENNPYPQKDHRVKYLVSFNTDISQIVEISSVSPTLIWVYSGDHQCKLIDIETESVIHDVKLEGNYSCLRPIDDQRIFLILNQDKNQIIRIKVKKKVQFENSLSIQTFLNHYEGQTSPDSVPIFLVRRAGGLVVFVCKREGCGCFSCDVPYLQYYTSKSVFVREVKLVFNRKKIIRHVTSMTENNNGHICLAGCENYGSDRSLVVVLNLQSTPHFVYRGNPEHKDMYGPLFSVSSLATNTKNEILMVTASGRFIEVINENGIFITRWSISSFCDDISCQSIVVDSNDKLWIVLLSCRLICIDLKSTRSGVTKTT